MWSIEMSVITIPRLCTWRDLGLRSDDSATDATTSSVTFVVKWANSFSLKFHIALELHS